MALRYRMLSRVADRPSHFRLSPTRELSDPKVFTLIGGGDLGPSFTVELDLLEMSLVLFLGERDHASYIKTAQLAPRPNCDAPIDVILNPTRFTITVGTAVCEFDDLCLQESITYIAYPPIMTATSITAICL
jgi:hypothetical protein